MFNCVPLGVKYTRIGQNVEFHPINLSITYSDFWFPAFEIVHTMRGHNPSSMEDETTSVMESLELLSKLDAKSCLPLLHKVVDGICHRSKPNFEEFSQTWSLHDWWSLNDVYTDLFKKAVKESWTKDQLLEHLHGLSENHQSVVYDVLSSREPEIRGQLLHDTHAISQAAMTDFDWKLKLVMSSDKISSIHEPLLSLDLEVQTTRGRETVSLELNKTQLDSLISSLEAANKALVQLKS